MSFGIKSLLTISKYTIFRNMLNIIQLGLIGWITHIIWVNLFGIYYIDLSPNHILNSALHFEFWAAIIIFSLIALIIIILERVILPLWVVSTKKNITKSDKRVKVYSHKIVKKLIGVNPLMIREDVLQMPKTKIYSFYFMIPMCLLLLCVALLLNSNYILSLIMLIIFIYVLHELIISLKIYQ